MLEIRKQKSTSLWNCNFFLKNHLIAVFEVNSEAQIKSTCVLNNSH